jgi:hypothetical protein
VVGVDGGGARGGVVGAPGGRNRLVRSAAPWCWCVPVRSRLEVFRRRE